MLSRPFERPVRVWVGLGFPRQLNTVVDAYQFVTQWCGNSPEQKAAIRACKAALAGEMDAETVRGMLIQFAKRKDILVEDGMTPPVAIAGRPSHL
jgi:hypothetical protein